MSSSRKMLGILAVTVLAIGCTSGGNTATDGGLQTSCDQQCLDANVGLAVVAIVSDLYNQSIAGGQTGTQNSFANCPLGGSATITGTTSLDATHNLTDVDLTYVMTSCEVLQNGDTLTFSGSIEQKGSFDSGSQQTVNFASSGLQYSGTVGDAGVSAPSTCTVRVNENSNASPSVTGSICGRTF